MRAYDWSTNPIGPPQLWPQSLRTALRILLNTNHPMFIWWGPELIQFYNDAYRQTMGPERHPAALGQRGRDCWEEIWPIIGGRFEGPRIRGTVIPGGGEFVDQFVATFASMRVATTGTFENTA